MTLYMKLYWVTTEDHDEDWFVFSKSKREAIQFFEDFEGYDRGDASAELVLRTKEAARPVEHAQLDLLRALGAKIIASNPRIVEINGRVYTEGTLEYELSIGRDDQFEAMGRGRPYGTIRREVDGMKPS